MSSFSDHELVAKERERVKDKLRRLGRAFVDGIVDEGDYDVKRKLLQDRMDSLVVPKAEATFDAGELLENLGPVWEKASLEEKNGLLLTMLEAVYIDLAASKSVVGMIPKPPFYPLFEALLDGSNAEVRVFRPQPEETESPSPDCEEGEEIISWWRRGRVELPVQKKELRDRYRLIRPFDLAPKTSTGEVSRDQLIVFDSPYQHGDCRTPTHRRLSLTHRGEARGDASCG